MNDANLLIFLAVLLPLFASVMFIPYWTRRTESFGVSIPEDVYRREDLRMMRKNYLLITGVLALLTLLVLWISFSHFSGNETAIGIVFGCLIAAYMVITFFVYLHFHQRMKKIKANEPEWSKKAQLISISTTFHVEKRVYSHLWFAIGFIIAIAMVILSLVKYEQIPDKFPIHYNLRGEPDGWSDKSLRSVLSMPIMQVYLSALFLFINVIISKSKQQISAADSEQSLRQNIIFRRRWSLFTIIMGNGLVASMSLVQLSMLYNMSAKLPGIVITGFAIASVLGAIVLSITTGQGGSRVTVKSAKSGDPQKIDRDDDRYWKLGMFYFNRNDPAIFLEKRFGVGWTNNWAHPLSWIFIIVIIGLAFLLPSLLSN
ncbi:DUF1648 domain-containing protein [Virgibacillus sp. 179-BFC.A HS]|uniref:DUF1648 domain-containing protein n=1 Tax=Tigheibacillus jepli TaxID=3035914 RepID=A0ABU5CN39_9BACI|nr:DUF1648 domain-containing protein [Virgibacillus sp. 179-BFC.A HS]MDY0406870.1 DUF1648 domain-containing protein [Virgibacillus sp. 179-BFC.A HS]